MAKTNAELQKEFRAKRKRDGWERIWIPVHLIAKVKELLQKGK